VDNHSKIQPTVSIVMPTYNHAKFINLAVSSVLAQTFVNWELIIIDNFSTDETIELLDAYSDERIKILQINNQGSIARSRNLGITSAKAEWIAFLDSDDYWQPQKLETVSTYFNPQNDLIYHDLSVLRASLDSPIQNHIRSRKLKSPILKDLILNGNTIATSSVVVRKETLLNVGGMSESPDVIGIEDYNTWLRVSLKTEKFALVPLSLGAYRMHSSNLSNSDYFKPPMAAIEEFLPLLTPAERRILTKNFEYLGARTRYLNASHEGIKKDLSKIIVGGRFHHKLKAFWMLLNLFF
jgi:glycosyltransferase involved in cell wall biosynthesis